MALNNKWLVQQVRVSVFPHKSTIESLGKLWPQIKGLELEKQVIEPKTGENIYEGHFNKNKVILVVNPVKIDFILGVDFPMQFTDKGPSVASIGDYKVAVGEFTSLIKPWLQSTTFPELTRVAFGAQAILQVSTRDEGYSTLSKFMPFKLDPKTMSDVSLQINLVAKSDVVKDLPLNRLTKWNVLTVTPELGSLNNPELAHKYPTTFLCNVDLDMNTSQDNKDILKKELIYPLLTELIGHGEKLIETGVKQ